MYQSSTGILTLRGFCHTVTAASVFSLLAATNQTASCRVTVISLPLPPVAMLTDQPHVQLVCQSTPYISLRLTRSVSDCFLRYAINSSTFLPAWLLPALLVLDLPAKPDSQIPYLFCLRSQTIVPACSLPTLPDPDYPAARDTCFRSNDETSFPCKPSIFIMKWFYSIQLCRT